MGLKKSTDREAGLRAVGTRTYPRNIEGFLAQLDDEDPSVRRWGARELAGAHAGVAAICKRLPQEVDATVREVMFTSLARTGGREVVTGVIPLLRSDDANLRNGAIEVLSGLPDDVAPAVTQLLTDLDGDVRIFAVNLMADLRHADVPKWLEGVLLYEPSVNVVGAALDLAAEVGDQRLLPAIRTARERFAREPYIAFAADLSIERIESA